MKKSILLAEAAWAAKTVHLLPEPPGERSGVVGAPTNGPLEAAQDPPIRFVAVGDSLVAGSGVETQAESLVPMISAHLAADLERSIDWETHARLGSTMRRVRHRLMDEITGDVDVLFICAGSNDIMARRTREDWIDDLTAVVEDAVAKADHVIVCSSGQPHNSPRLGRMLRSEVARRIDVQTEDSKRICGERGVDFVDVAHADLIDGFWATDGFHPSHAGYEMAASMVYEGMSFLDCLRAA